ncbi:glycosyltransferase family 2 protein [Ectothiorhodospira mobilis]|uniref:glycosyltransferase family 2 protein n=1 Tax=Ectothiorhodospira mobilis TaxID=195064 RepID=UPI00190731B1|nr:glycosyltransferase family A protein [Ectothiorhodospira mobilis]MBK1692156.1 hypothetical protein [Ectothiorhodospira mobilis]
MSTPWISVVIPAFNAAGYIGQALESVATQEMADLEVIVVDDGSTDGTAEVVAEGFPWVTLLRKENGGAGSARNLGVAHARGGHVAFLDADDVWLPGKLQAQWSCLQGEPHCRFCCTAFEHWFPEGGETDVAQPGTGEMVLDPERSGWVYHLLLLDCFVWTSTVLVERRLLEQVGGFDESLRLGQDYDLWLRISRQVPVHFLATPFAHYRHHSRSATARGAQANYGARVLEDALRRWGVCSPDGRCADPGAVRRRIADLHFAQGYRHEAAGRRLWAWREYLACLRHQAGRREAWLHLVSTGLPRSVRQRLGVAIPR